MASHAHIPTDTDQAGRKDNIGWRTFGAMSITHAQRQRVRNLQQRKWRRKYNAFVVDGLVNVNEVLGSTLVVEELYHTRDVGDQLQGLDRLNPGQIICVTEREFARLSHQKNPQGVLAVVACPVQVPDHLSSLRRILFLDSVSDPGNVGTLIRSAEWFGMEAIVAGPGSADWYNPKVVAAARGSLFRLPHLSLSATQLAAYCLDHIFIAADLDGVVVDQVRWPRAFVLGIGNESHGPGEELRGLSPKLVTIPRWPGSPTESLNAGVAGSILLAAIGRTGTLP